MAASVNDGWTMHEVPPHESHANTLCGLVEGYTEDCRRFATIARQAKLNELHHQFGLSWEAFCTTRLHATQDVVEAILWGVQVLGEDFPIPAEMAERVGRREQQRALAARNQAVDGENARVGPAHRPISHDNNKKDVMTSPGESADVRGTQGNSAAYALRRLKRVGRDDLHAQCLAGELTPHAAMIEAGLRKKPPSRKQSPLTKLYILWRQIDPEDRLRFLTEMLTPSERRALQYGYEDEDLTP